MLSLFRISWPIFFSFRFSFFFFWKEDKIDFLSNLSSLKLSHSDWHFPLVLPLTKTMTACHRLNAECQHFISEKAMLFLQELVFLMEPAYGPFNRKLKRLQNTIYQPFNQAVAIFFFLSPAGNRWFKKERWKMRGEGTLRSQGICEGWTFRALCARRHSSVLPLLSWDDTHSSHLVLSLGNVPFAYFLFGSSWEGYFLLWVRA